MIRINSRTKTEGELLVRRMSDKAQAYYYGTDGIGVCADDRGDDEGIEVSYDFGQSWKTVTFAELEAAFEEMQEEAERELREEEEEEEE